MNQNFRFLVFVFLVGTVGCSFFGEEPVQDPKVEKVVDSGKPIVEGEPEEDSSWYEMPVLRWMYGDFEKTNIVKYTDPEEIVQLKKRGQYLVKNVSSCGACHGENIKDKESPLSGGALFSDRFGLVRAANITPDKETGIGNWEISEVLRALRDGINNKGEPISLDSHKGFKWISDRDGHAIALYLQSLPPIKKQIKGREIGRFERNRLGILPIYSETVGYVPEIPEKSELHYGRYLATNVGRCVVCHTPPGSFSKIKPFSGSNMDLSNSTYYQQLKQSLFGKERERQAKKKNISLEDLDKDLVKYPKYGPDLRGSSKNGLKGWKNKDLIEYLTSGTTKSGKKVDGSNCPWPYYSGMTKRDKKAIAKYLKQL